jgi:hypothetical protein
MAGSEPAKLLGVLLYVREGDCLKVLYLALSPDTTASWRGSCSIISCVFDQLRRLARNIKGVRRIEFSLDHRNLSVRLS